jgi:hypothetical protein
VTPMPTAADLLVEHLRQQREEYAAQRVSARGQAATPRSRGFMHHVFGTD